MNEWIGMKPRFQRKIPARCVRVRRRDSTTQSARSRATHSPARHRELNFGGRNGRDERLPVADTRQIRETVSRRHGFIHVALRERLVRRAFPSSRRCGFGGHARYVTTEAGRERASAKRRDHSFCSFFMTGNLISCAVHTAPRSSLGYELV